MTRYSLLVRFALPALLLLPLCAIWQLRFTHKCIDSERAREIALNHLTSSPHLESVDTTRVTITFQDDTEAFVVDFAWKSADQIRPGLWSEGYFVVVDARSGDVIRATAYER